MIENSSTPLQALDFEARNLQQNKALSDLKNLGGKGFKEDEKLWEAARGFEAMFLSQMYKSMRKTLPQNDINKPSKGREIFTEMLDGEYAKMSTGKSENNLAGLIYRQLVLNREGIENSTHDKSRVNIKASKYNQSSKNNNIPSKSRLTDEELTPIITKAADTYGIDPRLVKSVIRQESGGNPLAVSPAGAKGLMQLMDGTAEEMGVRNVFNPEQNVMGGSRYLKELLDKYNGDEQLTLAAYNAGPGTVEKFGGIPPYDETRQYIEKVLATRANYNKTETGGGE